jgi:hypothetical protein
MISRQNERFFSEIGREYYLCFYSIREKYLISDDNSTEKKSRIIRGTAKSEFKTQFGVVDKYRVLGPLNLPPPPSTKLKYN